MHVRPIHWAKGVKYYVATVILFIMSTVLGDFMNEEKNYLVHLMRNSRVSKILDIVILVLMIQFLMMKI
jgi:hypothetical protein